MNDDTQQPTPININQQPDLEPQTPPPQPGEQFKPETPAGKPKKSKKKIVMIILLLLVLASGAAAAYFLLFKKDAAAPAPQPSSQQPQTTVDTAGPKSLVYNADNTASTLKLSTLNLDNKTTTTYNAQDFSQIDKKDIFKEKVAIVAAPKEKLTQYGIFYSEDNGNTFKNVYKTRAASSQDKMGEQITSLIFSSDGTTLIAGSLQDLGTTNTVVQIDLEKLNVKPLFTVDSAGVFLAGYDGKQAIYTKGCYNCGGGTYKTIYSYNVTSKKESAIINVAATNSIQSIHLSPDSSSFSYLETSTTEGDGGPIPTGPYSVKTFTFTSNKAETIKTFGEKSKEIFIDLGYTSDGDLYYAADKTVYSLKSSNQSDLFTTTKTLNEVLYVSNKAVIVSTGNYQAFTVSKYDTQNKELSEILKGTEKTSLVGVTYTR